MAEPKEQPKKIKLSVWLLEVYFNIYSKYAKATMPWHIWAPLKKLF